MPKPWTRLKSERILETIPFDVYSHRVKSPDGSIEDDFFTISSVDWVNVVATTCDGDLILIEQYRHGTDHLSLEIPGGMIDEGEEPQSAAIRELKEETGYGFESIESLGWIHPNPAIMSNRCHFFHMKNCVEIGSQSLDEHEDISVHLCPSDEAKLLLNEHKITHCLSAIALSRWLLREG